MNKTNIALGSALIAIVIAIGALLGVSHSAQPVGAIAPTDNSSTNFTEMTASNGIAVGTANQFQVSSTGNETKGGSVLSTSTLGSATLAQSDLQNSIIQLAEGAPAGGTITLPASSTLTTFVPTAGQCQSLMFVNSTTTAGIDVTLAGGAGTTLLKVATSSAKINGSHAASVLFCRKSNTDLVVEMRNTN